ncbi:MAG: hypothetical protein AMJ93_15395 [Anaerolineae bacterium SM23_84]|nr:MAG: hypothetical protein AMJ93_15395 [Anaerolineae bacterium SM23_84]
MSKRKYIGIVLVLSLALLAVAINCRALPNLQAQEAGVDLTVYNQNLALVQERRTVQLEEGVNEVAFQDVAALIDPTSVLFRSLTDPAGTIVLEQNYEYDIVGSQKLLQKYVDQDIELVTEDGSEYAGKLLSGTQDIILQAGDGRVTIVKLAQVREFSFPQLPEGLITKPTLLWQIEADEAGPHNIEVTYMTGGITWQADYVLLLDETDENVDLEGWITLSNNSGAAYREAKVKLIAGDVHRTQDALAYAEGDVRSAPSLVKESEVEERAFFEYHLYEVQRPITVKDHQTKQIEFTTASGVPAAKFFVYDASQRPFYSYEPLTEPSYGYTGSRKVMVMLEFENSEEASLGIPLPRGRVRVYKEDVDGSTQFIGEDRIDHTPKDENVRLYLGDAFDIVGERKQTDFRKPSWRTMIESFEITIRNHKDEAVELRVVEHMFRWTEWEITAETHEHTKTDAQTVEYHLELPADGEEIIEYTVFYRW